MVEKINRFSSIIEGLKEKKLYRKERVLFRLTKFPGVIFTKNFHNVNILKKKDRIISFSSNNYLGLCENKTIIQAGIKALKKYGAGAVSSKFIEGYNAMYKDIENIIKKIKNTEDAIIFNSGYNANLGIFTSLFKKNDIIFLDELSHASSFEGAKLSGAKIIRYTHNNPEDLDKKIQKHGLKHSIGIATETIFSMKGSVLLRPSQYVEIAKKYNAILITDEAHSLGVMEFDFPPFCLHIKMGTFSKSIASIGGYVCGSQTLIDVIRNLAKSGIYTTALPPASLASTLAALQLLQNGYNGKKALENADFFGKCIEKQAESQILFLETDKSEEISQTLFEKGFFVKSIKKPTVNKGGLRISFNNLHKKVDIKKLAFILKNIL